MTDQTSESVRVTDISAEGKYTIIRLGRCKKVGFVVQMKHTEWYLLFTDAVNDKKVSGCAKCGALASCQEAN